MTLYANLTEEAGGPLTAGDDLQIVVNITDTNDPPIVLANITSAKFVIVANGQAVVEKDLTDGIAIDGQTLVVSLDAADTEGMRGSVKFEVEIVDVSGKYRTPVWGDAEFRRALITNAD